MKNIYIYHKIQTLFFRDMEAEGRIKPVMVGKWATPEFELLQNIEWIGTEKIHGTNVRVIWKQKFDGIDPIFEMVDGVVGDPWMEKTFRGKTDNAQMPPQLMERLGAIFSEDKLKKTFGTTDVCMYGEGFGGRIQDYGPHYGEIDFILFDVKVGYWWLERDAVDEIAKSFGIRSVPVVFKGTLWEAVEMVEGGFTSQVAEKTDLIAEGLILEPKKQLFTRKGERIITKLKYKDF